MILFLPFLIQSDKNLLTTRANEIQEKYKDTWNDRFRDIVYFEYYCRVLKLFWVYDISETVALRVLISGLNFIRTSRQQIFITFEFEMAGTDHEITRIQL